jgi:hypothetical protein
MESHMHAVSGHEVHGNLNGNQHGFDANGTITHEHGNGSYHVDGGTHQDFHHHGNSTVDIGGGYTHGGLDVSGSVITNHGFHHPSYGVQATWHF